MQEKATKEQVVVAIVFAQGLQETTNNSRLPAIIRKISQTSIVSAQSVVKDKPSDLPALDPAVVEDRVVK